MRPEFRVPSDHRVAAHLRWGRVEGLTLTPLGASQGQREFLWLRPGFYVAMGQLSHRAARRDVYPSGDLFKLHFRLAGESQVGPAAGMGSQRVAPLTMSTLVQPANSLKEEHFAAGVHERSITLCCSRPFLAEALGSAPAPLGGQLGDYLNGPHNSFVLTHLPLNPHQITLANALLGTEPSDPYRGLLAEAKAFELLHSFLAHPNAQQNPLMGSRASTACAQVAALRCHLDDHLAKPLDLALWARRQGTTEVRLARGFRQEFGVSVHEYVADARLRQGRQLLAAGTLSVTEVAYQMGYSHVASFSTAFKRTFGCTPHSVRRAGGARPH